MVKRRLRTELKEAFNLYGQKEEEQSAETEEQSDRKKTRMVAGGIMGAKGTWF